MLRQGTRSQWVFAILGVLWCYAWGINGKARPDAVGLKPLSDEAILVCPSLDGSFYGFSTKEQKDDSVYWHRSVGEPIAFSHIKLGDDRLVVVGADEGGSVYTYDKTEKMMKKWQYTVPQMVRDAPVEMEGFLFTGTKISTTFILDPKTGAVSMKRSLDGESSSTIEEGSVLVLRVTYLVEAYELETGNSAGNLSYAEHHFFSPSHSDRKLAVPSPSSLKLVDKYSPSSMAPVTLSQDVHDLAPAELPMKGHLVDCHMVDPKTGEVASHAPQGYFNAIPASARGVAPKKSSVPTEDQVYDGAALMHELLLDLRGGPSSAGTSAEVLSGNESKQWRGFSFQDISPYSTLLYLMVIVVFAFWSRVAFMKARLWLRQFVGEGAVWLYGFEVVENEPVLKAKESLSLNANSMRIDIERIQSARSKYSNAEGPSSCPSNLAAGASESSMRGKPRNARRGISRCLFEEEKVDDSERDEEVKKDEEKESVGKSSINAWVDSNNKASRVVDSPAWEISERESHDEISSVKRGGASLSELSDSASLDHSEVFSPAFEPKCKNQEWEPESKRLEDAMCKWTESTRSESTREPSMGGDGMDSIFERDSLSVETEGLGASEFPSSQHSPSVDIPDALVPSESPRPQKRSKSMVMSPSCSRGYASEGENDLDTPKIERNKFFPAVRTRSSTVSPERDHPETTIEALSPISVKDGKRVPDSPLGVTFSRHSYDLGFEELGVLGCGAYGVVAKAKNLMDGVVYAIKKVKLKEKESVWLKVSREVHAMARVTNHQNVVTYFNSWVERLSGKESLMKQSDVLVLGELGDASVGTLGSSILGDHSCSDSEGSLYFEEDDGNDDTSRLILYIQMEMCGESLTDWMNREKKAASVQKKLGFFRQMLNGIHHVHSLDFVHRDIKPSNIFIQNEVLKLGDFGLAKNLGSPAEVKEEEAALMSTNMSDLSIEDGEKTTKVGSTLYASPEQLNGRRVSHQSDIFSLGLVLAELMMCFSTEMERVHTLHQLRAGQIPKELVEIDPEIAKCVKRMVDHDPKKRPDALEVLTMEFMKSESRDDLVSLVNTLTSELRRRAISE